MEIGQLQSIAESIQDGSLQKPGPDDRFRFSCKRCGECCANNTIIVSVHDVIRMRRSLNMTQAG